MIKAHRRFNSFFRTLSAPELYSAWAGSVLRQAAPRWLSRPYRLTGAGSVLVGGRWSVRGLMPSVYAATDPDTLHAEAYYKGRRYGWAATDFHPQLIVGMHWRLEKVLNLTAPGTLRSLRVRKEDLVACDWAAEQAAGREALTQAIARAAFEHLAEALLVESARHPGGLNVVFFPAHRRSSSVLEVTNSESLPPDLHGLDA